MGPRPLHLKYIDLELCQRTINISNINGLCRSN